MTKIYNKFKTFFIHFPNFGVQKKKKLWKIQLSRTTSYGFLVPWQNLEKTNDTIPKKQQDRWKDKGMERRKNPISSSIMETVTRKSCSAVQKKASQQLRRLKSYLLGHSQSSQSYLWWAQHRVHILSGIYPSISDDARFVEEDWVLLAREQSWSDRNCSWGSWVGVGGGAATLPQQARFSIMGALPSHKIFPSP